MTHDEFNQLLELRLKTTKLVLGAKASEYAFGDRLSNFKRAAATLETSPENALLGMLTKHLVSLMDMIDSIGDQRFFPLDTWREKIGDSINYLILLEALVYERVKENRNGQHELG